MNCLNCSNPIQQPASGRQRRFCNDACKMAFHRKNKIKSIPSPGGHEPPQNLPQTPDNQPLTPAATNKYAHLDANPFDLYPKNIAPYMPTRSDLAILHAITRPRPDADCKF